MTQATTYMLVGMSMGRSPLMRAISKLAQEHQAAQAAGLPVDEFRGLDRRNALRLGVGVAAAPLLAKVSPHRTDARIAIIGAGMAGMAAALKLNDAGVPCTVYEASSRVGGRMYSEVDYWGGQTSEYGGELIDTGHKTLLHMAQRFGLDTVDVGAVAPNGADQMFWFDGGYYPRAQLDDDFKAVNHAVQRDLHAALPEVSWNSGSPSGIALDKMSLYEWIESRVPGGHASRLGSLLDTAYTIEYGLDTGEQSALALIYMLGYMRNPGHVKIWGLSDERYHIVGGNQQVPQAIAATLPSATIQHGWRLLAVRANTDGTQTLTFDDGRTIIADHTILTVPLGILKKLDLSRAGLDTRMRGVIANMKMGMCTKLNMQFNSRPWLGSGPWPGVSSGEAFTDLAPQQVWDATAGQAGAGGILIQYHAGSLASALNPPQAISTSSSAYVRSQVAAVLRDVEAFYPGTSAAWNGRAILSAWHKHDLAYGAYAAWPVGYVHQYAGYEGVRQGNLHFSGEHTSYDFQGYMNGAAVEGDRAAQEVLDAI